MRLKSSLKEIFVVVETCEFYWVHHMKRRLNWNLLYETLINIEIEALPEHRITFTFNHSQQFIKYDIYVKRWISIMRGQRMMEIWVKFSKGKCDSWTIHNLFIFHTEKRKPIHIWNSILVAPFFSIACAQERIEVLDWGTFHSQITSSEYFLPCSSGINCWDENMRNFI